MELGKIKSLWRYPVKSLIGEEVERLEIDERGVKGDRLYAVSNTEGKFGSGKDTRRFRRIDGLATMSAKMLDNNGVSIHFPDETVLTDKDTLLNDKLSQTLEQSVTLTKEGEISHFDDGSVHILSTASLSLLEDLLPNSGIDVRRFRPNIVIDSEYLDKDLVGKTVKIGDTILEITHKTVRCRMITIDQLDLESRAEILKVVSKSINLDFGVYAKVVSTGSVFVGSLVEVL
jgi:uncharacterized protein YcbX